MKYLLMIAALIGFMASEARAVDLKVEDTVGITDVASYLKNLSGDRAGSGAAAGIVLGPMASVRNGEATLFGFGGLTLNVSSRVGETTSGDSQTPIGYGVGFMPLSVYNILFSQVGYNLTDGTYFVGASLSVTQAIKLGWTSTMGVE